MTMWQAEWTGESEASRLPRIPKSIVLTALPPTSRGWEALRAVPAFGEQPLALLGENAARDRGRFPARER